jgi:hypothetical protein
MSQILHSNAFYSRESSGLASLVDTDLAGENVTKGSKGVVEGLVVNALVEVLDEDVSLSSLSESRVSLTPHDSAWPVLDQGVVEVLESSLAVSRVEVVDVGVSKRSTSHGVSADSDAGVSQREASSPLLTHLATGPIMLKISNNIASVTDGSSSPT